MDWWLKASLATTYRLIGCIRSALVNSFGTPSIGRCSLSAPERDDDWSKPLPQLDSSGVPQLHSCGMAEFRTAAPVARKAPTLPQSVNFRQLVCPRDPGNNRVETPVTIGVGALSAMLGASRLAGKFENDEKTRGLLMSLAVIASATPLTPAFCSVKFVEHRVSDPRILANLGMAEINVVAPAVAHGIKTGASDGRYTPYPLSRLEAIMAHFAEFSPKIRDYGKQPPLKNKAVVAGDELVVVLWGGGPPPDNKPLDVTVIPPTAARIAELASFDSINRTFRIIALDGVAVIQGLNNGLPFAAMSITVQFGPPSPPKETPTDLSYDGVTLHWPARKKTYNASSGLPATPGSTEPDWRDSQFYCVKDHGPVPEGMYSLSTVVDPNTYAKVNKDPDVCTVYAGKDIQKIPRGADAGACEAFWVNWGKNRVALKPSDAETRNACSPVRDGFYLHDSTKGFSHGCIEVQGIFFDDLYDFAKSAKGKRLTLRVKYTHQSTQGGTKVP
jgi:hypothetical protein